jgi:predicted phage tail protein
MLEELVIQDPSMHQSYSFVPVIGGSKSSGLMMVLGVALIAATGGLAGFGISGFMGAAGTGAGMVGTTAAGAGLTAAGGVAGGAGLTAAGTYTIAGAAAAAGTSTAAILATQGLGYLGTALMLGGAAMMLAPDVPDGTSAEKAENYLFSGPVNTIKQGQAIPLVYGRAIVGSKTISASVFTNSSRQKITKGRKMVGIPNFRTDGSKSGTGSITTSSPNNWGYGRGIGSIIA